MVSELLPHLQGVLVERLEQTGDAMVVHARVRAPSVACPGCGVMSGRVHSRYRRQLVDAPVAARPVQLRLSVRRLFCDNPACRRRTFVEQVPGLTRWRRRFSQAAIGVLTPIALVLAGRAGARLAGTLGVSVSRSSLLRLVRALPDPPVEPVTVLGCDDFAFRRGHTYGTILIDSQTHQVVDLLAGRDGATLADWLRGHPRPEVIVRDRSGSYAEGARTGAPGAVQVADRFHLWQNLTSGVERCVATHRDALPAAGGIATEPAPQVPMPTESAAAPEPDSVMARRRLEHHRLVHDLLAQGLGVRAIAARLGWGRHTVQRYARAERWQDMLVGYRRRPSRLDPYAPYLRERIAAGCTNARALHRELVAQGLRCGYGPVRDFVAAYRSAPESPPTPKPPSVRQVTGWICRRPERLRACEHRRLVTLGQHCAALQTATSLVGSFRDMMTAADGERVSSWITQATAADLPGISAFARGLTADLDAVRAGISLPWSAGPTEGNVNRLKMIKRKTYGRSNLDLLRKLVLLGP